MKDVKGLHEQKGRKVGLEKQTSDAMKRIIDNAKSFKQQMEIRYLNSSALSLPFQSNSPQQVIFQLNNLVLYV